MLCCQGLTESCRRLHFISAVSMENMRPQPTIAISQPLTLIVPYHRLNTCSGSPAWIPFSAFESSHWPRSWVLGTGHTLSIVWDINRPFFALLAMLTRFHLETMLMSSSMDSARLSYRERFSPAISIRDVNARIVAYNSKQYPLSPRQVFFCPNSWFTYHWCAAG